ncbi:hypothetical protein HMPREF7215_0037 [Pyramidobacter piscolens W5455]|uniref:Uncharacterized protein n=1 Tax=Pyramidobacter piscolens W5455 TaxID=352165 RepID=A0ABM9ZUK3_9BACT|nr:hypothetical protein HMPREF7215_0037 [Pyramidobacter piscolens W5455]
MPSQRRGAEQGVQKSLKFQREPRPSTGSGSRDRGVFFAPRRSLS